MTVNIDEEIKKKINPKHGMCWVCNKKITIRQMITDPATINRTHIGIQMKPQMNYCHDCYKSKFEPTTAVTKTKPDSKSTKS